MSSNRTAPEERKKEKTKQKKRNLVLDGALAIPIDFRQRCTKHVSCVHLPVHPIDNIGSVRLFASLQSLTNSKMGSIVSIVGIDKYHTPIYLGYRLLP